MAQHRTRPTLGHPILFWRTFDKSGVIEAEYGRIYSRARKMREKHDYDLDAAWPSVEEAEQIVADAERFVARVERYLNKVGAI